MNILPNWIRKLVAIDRPRCRRPLSTRPWLESLEQREVLTTLVLPQTDVPTFTATFNITEASQPIQVDEPVSGGNFLGTLNGTTKLVASYCVNIDLTIFPGTTYSKATVTNDGTVNGSAVPQAGAISWLLTHLGPTATTPIQQDALQAAIWRTEYGNGFQLDGVDNDNGAPMINAQIAPFYQADLAALGHNTAAVNAVDWISPGANPDSSQGQGLVADLNQTVTQTSKTTLQSSLPTATVGQSVTLTATVAPQTGSGTPTGTVTFMDGTVKLGTATLNAGQAQFATNGLAVGNQTLTAVYGGSGAFEGSTSSPLIQKVNQAATKVVLTSSANPAVVGQFVTLTAKVSIVAPGAAALSGTVTFKDGATVLGTGTLTNGVATFQTAKLSEGNNTLTAVYGGNTNLTSSTSTALTEGINPAATTVTLTSSTVSGVLGQLLTLTAKVSIVAPGAAALSGMVTFKDGTTVLGTATLINGVATLQTAKPSVGKNTLTAVYGGNANLKTSTSTTLLVTINPAATTVTLTSSAVSAVFAQLITLTAKVSVVAPGATVLSGTVTYKDGTTVLGTATLINGVATFQTAKLSKGKHTLTVVFGGNGDLTGSTSTTLTEVIS